MNTFVRLSAVLLLVVVLAGCVSTQAIRQEYIASNPELSEKEKSAIMGGRIYVGMSSNSVAYSWGNPYSVSRSSSTYGNSETWYYKYFYQYWRTTAIVYFRQDQDGVYRVRDITQFGR